MKLLTLGNPKTAKGEARSYLTSILHLAPARLSGYQVCPGASRACEAGCLNTAGRGGMFAQAGYGPMTGGEMLEAIRAGRLMNPIQAARIRKTRQFFEARSTFLAQLVKDIDGAIRKATREGLTPVFRLNGTSDIRWETIRDAEGRTIFERFPGVQFYDYTKLTNRRDLPSNYHLTFSRSEEHSDEMLQDILRQGINVAVVFRTNQLPETYLGHRVVNGDETDLRFLEGSAGVVVGLKAKGKARRDQSGFVVEISSTKSHDLH